MEAWSRDDSLPSARKRSAGSVYRASTLVLGDDIQAKVGDSKTSTGSVSVKPMDFLSRKKRAWAVGSERCEVCGDSRITCCAKVGWSELVSRVMCEVKVPASGDRN